MRHYYMSLLNRPGESVKTVQARVGHASGTETLDTCSHLWPDSDDRTRLPEVLRTIFGVDPGIDDVRAVRGVAGIIEEPRLYPYLSGRRNLELLAARWTGRVPTAPPSMRCSPWSSCSSAPTTR